MTRFLRSLGLAVLGLFPSAAFPTVISIPAPFVHPADQNPQTSEVPCTHSASAFRCVKFLSNHDGDTLTVNIPDVHPLLGQKASVRLFGVDTPELYSADLCEREAAVRAQRFVREILLRGSRIDLERVKRDKYFRILADVHVNGESVSQALIDRGLAYPYFGGTKQRIDWCLSRP